MIIKCKHGIVVLVILRVNNRLKYSTDVKLICFDKVDW